METLVAAINWNEEMGNLHERKWKERKKYRRIELQEGCQEWTCLYNAIFNNNLANEILSELQWSDGTVLASQSPDLLLVGF